MSRMRWESWASHHRQLRLEVEKLTERTVELSRHSLHLEEARREALLNKTRNGVAGRSRAAGAHCPSVLPTIGEQQQVDAFSHEFDY